MPLPAVAAIGAAAGKAGAAAGKAGGAAAKGAAKAGKGAAKKAAKGAAKKVKRKLMSRVLNFISNPIVQMVFAIFTPLAVIIYQLIPSLTSEIKLIRAVVSLSAGGTHAFVSWAFIIVAAVAIGAGAAAGDAVAGEAGMKVGMAIAAFFAAPATVTGGVVAMWHLILVGLAWFIIAFKFMMRRVMPKRM